MTSDYGTSGVAHARTAPRRQKKGGPGNPGPPCVWGRCGSAALLCYLFLSRLRTFRCAFLSGPDCTLGIGLPSA